jgi:hypothetical protein
LFFSRQNRQPGFLTASLGSLAAVTAAAPGAGKLAFTGVATAAAAPAPPATSVFTSPANALQEALPAADPAEASVTKAATS